MSTIIKAKVLTNSADDNYARVKLSADGAWQESPLVVSVNSIPLVKGDSVFVDVTEGYENPIILGRFQDDDCKKLKSTNGSILFQSGSDASWVTAFVKAGKLEIHNSSNTSVVIDGTSITINGGNNGGVLNISAFTAMLNALKVYSTAMSSFTGVLEPLGAPAQILNSALEAIVNTEDLKVKH